MPNKIALDQEFPSIVNSNALYERAKDLIPSFTQTLAKGPGQYVNGIAPKYLQRAKGSHVWDVDGNEFIDLNMAIGPISLGYAYDRIDEAIRAQLADGITFSMMHPLEVEVAELMREVVPNAESVRYSKTGADATSAAVRVARAYTGRDKVLCCGYHGWHDWYISVTDRNKGIPATNQELTFTFNYNDISALEDAFDSDIACVIMEPVVFEAPVNDFLHQVREICDRNGALLIFDEMWTGFRLSAGGAQEYFGIDADMATFSKAIANGMPISVLSGKREFMQLLDKDVFFYTTFGGEALSLAAAKATIHEIREKNVPQYLAQKGAMLKNGYNKIAEELGLNYTRCIGFDCRSIITFDASAGNPLHMKSLVQQELLKHGVLWGGFHNMSFSHSDEDILHVLSTYKRVLPVLKDAVDHKNISERLKGTSLEPVFRKTSNFNTKPKVKAVAE